MKKKCYISVKLNYKINTNVTVMRNNGLQKNNMERYGYYDKLSNDISLNRYD